MSDDDGYEPYQWQVGDPADWADSIGVPDIPYMGYLNGDNDDEYPNPPRKSKSMTFHDEAWNLRNQGKYQDALVLINRALEHDGRYFDNWNVKAIILEDMGKYEEAIECYDEALMINATKTVKNNKAYSLSRLAEMEKYKNRDYHKALNYINEALKLVSDDSRKNECLHIKGNILELMGRRVDGYVCHLLASGMPERVEEIENQQKIIKSSSETLINITGTRFYENFRPFEKDVIVDLIAEPDNTHDPDAIRVEKDGKTVGYVANSNYTLIDGVKSATQLKGKLKENRKAKVMFIHASEYVIAKVM